MDAIEVLRTLLELGWPGLVLVAVVHIWRNYTSRTDELIAQIGDQLSTCHREREQLLGIILDNAKMRRPAAGEMYDPDRIFDTRPVPQINQSPLTGGD